MSLAHDLIGVKQNKGARRPRAPSNPAPKRPDNVPRELYLLTGGVTPPSLVPAPQTALKSKPKLQTKWKLTPFTNTARDDKLELSHFTKVGQPQTEYAFVRFNKKIQMIKYTDEEYKAVLQKLEPLEPAPNNLPMASEFDVKPKKTSNIYKVVPQRAWSKAETDTLFELCEQFDLRFIVINDRWPDEKFGLRTVDELKDRYYAVAKRLLEYRQQKNQKYMESLSLSLYKHSQALCVNPFDYEYETIRKNQLEVEYNRSKAELREEEEIVREARRIEANRKRAVKERQRLTKLITPHGDIGLSGDGKALVAIAGSNVTGKLFRHRKQHTSAYARSSLIYDPVTQSARISKQIDEVLDELGVGTRPTPTAIITDLFDLLRLDILNYLELQRTVLRKEEDVYALRVKLAALKSEPAPAPPAGVAVAHKKRRIDEVT
eukprot:Plantae.Rhodophyta-Hildenbrandia_rubra.ctg14458.p1 GENE.Plantae.Rhodophyta-Hildenbrandia_rubra.ctg14458~~Plantae.Rhodophyta-Hildenbrandia_rubra.ctg14458.p1  ORF type:complete len:433 (+),score=78.28 Plantae.Rhodophyta-Hildenbrandia_rubra.ctg14458:199-1497(+)